MALVGQLEASWKPLPAALHLFLKWLSTQTYPGFLPHPAVRESDRVENYLSDLWREAPWRVAVLHTALALFVLFSPVFVLGRPRLFSSLSPASRDKLILKLLENRIYLFRLAAYAFRGNAFVAAFRDVRVRESMIPKDLFASAPRQAVAPSTRSVPALPAQADYVVIGSGAAGASAALALAELGAEVVILEEGGWYRREDFTEDAYGAIRNLFRDFGTQAATGRAIFPVMQGSCVGGSTVINGGITHRMPRAIYEEWATDARLSQAISWQRLEEETAQLETDLGVRANLEPLLAGLPVAEELRRKQWQFQAMERNAPGCQATGRCLQGCPSGGKLSMEASFIPRALAFGARIFPRHRVSGIGFSGKRATSVFVETPEGEKRLHARKGILLAAGAVHSPLLLLKSGLNNPHLGQHFLCHLGLGVIAVLPRGTSARELEGPPQGIEILQFSDEGIKLATQLLPPEFLLSRIPVTGEELVGLFREAQRLSSWTASIRSAAEGSVRPGPGGKPRIQFTPNEKDVRRAQKSIALLAELLFDLGAEQFFPGVTGAPRRILGKSQIGYLHTLSLDPRRYTFGVGHLFGTCRMHSDPAQGAVDEHFRPHGTEHLYIVDASIFPTSLGVNPQLVIMALARYAAKNLT